VHLVSMARQQLDENDRAETSVIVARWGYISYIGVTQN
jgi:hypothetical protein